ncbi:hypothetical protein Bbelb_324760 [Branchiostoma belcheri]|nr:hypothetical protein Bbelb_324760 [Branchiostoma belcheri]
MIKELHTNPSLPPVTPLTPPVHPWTRTVTLRSRISERAKTAHLPSSTYGHARCSEPWTTRGTFSQPKRPALIAVVSVRQCCQSQSVVRPRFTIYGRPDLRPGRIHVVL